MLYVIMSRESRVFQHAYVNGLAWTRMFSGVISSLSLL